MSEHTNKLIAEKSPYLLQHAHNPVEWYPWGDEAFEKAKREDKPIFLSIGYSTCYWCHVMEREVFEHEAIAALMNNHVVSIKVDREERPDIDRVYMAALQAMTGSGGWPMSMFLTPDRKPFFGATYIPPAAKYGRAGFEDVIARIHEAWTNDRTTILESGDQIISHLQNVLAPSGNPSSVGKHTLAKALESFLRGYDHEYGGFGRSPKFPTPVSFNFLFRHFVSAGDPKALEMAITTLRNICNGGIYDHLAGGFHRYSTDARWHVPHFEKMLYDQAQMVVSLLEAYQVSGEQLFAQTAVETLEYVSREMTSPEGGFYSAQDAESLETSTRRKKEGAFYTWRKDDIDRVLTMEEAELFGYVYDVQERGNVKEDPHGEFGGLNVFHRVRSMDEAEKKFGFSTEECSRILQTARRKLLAAREQRPRPHLDDKVILSWNGLMISAFAKAFQVLGSPKYLDQARHASDFILGTMWSGTDARRRYREGEARFEAHLEDYAFFIRALLDLYESTFEIRWLVKAMELSQRERELFWDQEGGGFFDTDGRDHSIPLRSKESTDGAEPSGNAIAILNLLRLGQMIDSREDIEAAEMAMKYFGDRMAAYPTAMAQFLVALDWSMNRPREIIIAGKAGKSDTAKLVHEVHRRFIPHKVLLLADGGDGQRLLARHVPFIGTLGLMKGNAAAYVCQNFSCRLPTDNPAVLGEILLGKDSIP